MPTKSPGFLFMYSLIFTLLVTGAATAQETAVVSVDPDEIQLAENQSAGLAINVESATGVFGFEIHAAFDPAIFQITDADPSTPGDQVLTGDFLTAGNMFVVLNQVDNATGTIDFAVSLLAPAEPVSGNGILISFEIEAVGSGSSVLFLESILLASQGGLALPVETQNGLVVIGDGAPSLTFTVVAPTMSTPLTTPTGESPTTVPGGPINPTMTGTSDTPVTTLVPTSTSSGTTGTPTNGSSAPPGAETPTLAIIGTPVADITPLAVRTRAEGDSISSVQSDPLFLEDAGGALETRQILTETATDLDSDRSETLAELQGLTKLTADAIAIEQEGGVNRTAEELADETKTERNGQDTSLLIILVVLVVALAALFIWSGRRSRGA